jgi:hypothetical protein
VTWVNIATGRHSWPAALASGVIRVSGNRADLSELLPLPGFRDGAAVTSNDD